MLTMFDITAIGEALIDLTQTGLSASGVAEYAANPGGVTPRLTSANKNNWYDSSFWMKSAAYLRLKNIQLGYDLPKSWMRKIGLKSAYVYVNAQNLFTATNFWDGYDPEVGYDGDASGDFDLVKLGSANNYPQVKLVTIGLDLKF